MPWVMPFCLPHIYIYPCFIHVPHMLYICFTIHLHMLHTYCKCSTHHIHPQMLHTCSIDRCTCIYNTSTHTPTYSSPMSHIRSSYRCTIHPHMYLHMLHTHLLHAPHIVLYMIHTRSTHRYTHPTKLYTWFTHVLHIHPHMLYTYSHTTYTFTDAWGQGGGLARMVGTVGF